LLNEIHNKQEKAITSKKERKQIPTIDEFISVFKMYLNFTQVGKYFGVTDNSVRKWCKKYGLPIHTKELCRYIHNM
jgi:hypothetical protein